MKIIGKRKLFVFSERHSDIREWVANWLKDVESSRWRLPQDVKDRYATASFLAENVVIFNVRGNRYRLETQIAYQLGIVAVKWIGTHAEYTRRYR
jgi:mRNA interferase HigB